MKKRKKINRNSKREKPKKYLSANVEIWNLNGLDIVLATLYPNSTDEVC